MTTAHMATDVIAPLARIDCDDCGYDGGEDAFSSADVEEMRRLATRHARQLYHSVNFEVLRRSVYRGEAPE